MRMPKTIEEAQALQQRLDTMSVSNDAYVNDESRWKASRFAMDIIREISAQTGRSILDTYCDLQRGDSIENYILRHYDIMHTQDFMSTIHDVTEYARSHAHAI